MKDSLGRHVDILAIGAVLSCYALLVAAQSGMERLHTFVLRKHTVIERIEHHRRIAPTRIAGQWSVVRDQWSAIRD
jgi:hypothetical protein